MGGRRALLLAVSGKWVVDEVGLGGMGGVIREIDVVGVM